MKICIIGNNAHGKQLTDGGRIKTRMYANKLVEEGCDVSFIDLDGWKKHIISTLHKMKKAIKQFDRIIIMAGPNGCRKIIPIVNFFNRKEQKPIVFCPLGIGTLDFILKNKSPNEVNDFLSCKSFLNIKDKKMGGQLKKLATIVLQNQIIKTVYETFYGLTNCVVLENFRDANIVSDHAENENLKLIYISRINSSKGILDLMDAVNSLNFEGYNIDLDIFGEIQLLNNDLVKFNNFIKASSSHILYKGLLKNEDVVKTINKYELFCFPTKYHGEGTPGVLIESFFAGTPCLISSYSQAELFVNDSVDGFIFKINDKEDLKNKLKFIYEKNNLAEIRNNVIKKAQKYTYEYNRDSFINSFMGGKTK